MQAIAHLHLIIFTTAILIENYVEERNVLPFVLQLSFKTLSAPIRGLYGPFWISREPFAWPWCNLAASQRRPYCSSVNSHSPMGLVSRQWDAVDWACVLCDGRIYKSPPFRRRFYFWENPEVAGSQIWAGGGLIDLGDVMLCQKKARMRAEEWAGALSDLLSRSLWMRRSHGTQAQSTASHCRLTSPTGVWLFTDAK
jgi:hypothetical protein